MQDIFDLSDALSTPTPQPDPTPLGLEDLSTYGVAESTEQYGVLLRIQEVRYAEVLVAVTADSAKEAEGLAVQALQEKVTNCGSSRILDVPLEWSTTTFELTQDTLMVHPIEDALVETSREAPDWTVRTLTERETVALKDLVRRQPRLL